MSAAESKTGLDSPLARKTYLTFYRFGCETREQED
jgi:hypothetical protein